MIMVCANRASLRLARRREVPIRVARLRFASDVMPEANFDGELLVYDPPRTLEMRWGTDILRFELRPDGAGTVLAFSDTITEVGKGARDTAGWHVCIDRLESALDGTSPDGNPHWKLLNEMYVERFGPEASTIGPPQEWQDAYGDS